MILAKTLIIIIYLPPCIDRGQREAWRQVERRREGGDRAGGQRADRVAGGEPGGGRRGLRRAQEGTRGSGHAHCEQTVRGRGWCPSP